MVSEPKTDSPAMGEQRLPGFAHLYGLCHVPLDNILIGRLKDYKFQPLPCAWSKLTDYDIYLDRQLWVRSNFPLAPLDVEFQLWMGRQLHTSSVEPTHVRSHPM
jgi:hypothetical protein